MREFIALCTSALLVISLSLSAVARDRIEEHWIPPSATEAGQVGFGFDDREDYFFIPALRAVVYQIRNTSL
jgi:hypothetical protein